LRDADLRDVDLRDVDLRAEDFLPEDRDELLREPFLAEDAVRLRPPVFRAPVLRERERLLPPFLRALDFLDVAMTNSVGSKVRRPD
jgi:hypothetical protein